MPNHNNEFILEFILRKTKMADFERWQLEIQLEFVRWNSTELNNFSEGSSESKKDAQSNSSAGGGSPTSFFNLNYLFLVS